MTDLYPTKTRLAFLGAVKRRRIVKTGSGATMWRLDAGYSRRCESAAREAAAAGWVALGADGCTYELTEVGRAVLDGGYR